jgi:hypothetical protein
MKRFVIGISILGLAAPAFAQFGDAGNEILINRDSSRLIRAQDFGGAGQRTPLNSNAIYSSLNDAFPDDLNIPLVIFNPAGAANVSGTARTRNIYDDVHFDTTPPANNWGNARTMRQVCWTITQGNTGSVPVSMSLRFWEDGNPQYGVGSPSSGQPGNYYGTQGGLNQAQPAGPGVTFIYNPIPQGEYIDCVDWKVDLYPGGFADLRTPAAGNKMWWGMQFNNINNPTVTLAQLNNFGVVRAQTNPIDVGESNPNNAWLSAPGNYFGVNFPPGSRLDQGYPDELGSQPENYGFEFVPEPVTASLLGLGILGLLRRRR